MRGVASKTKKVDTHKRQKIWRVVNKIYDGHATSCATILPWLSTIRAQVHFGNHVRETCLTAVAMVTSAYLCCWKAHSTPTPGPTACWRQMTSYAWNGLRTLSKNLGCPSKHVYTPGIGYNRQTFQHTRWGHCNLLLDNLFLSIIDLRV